MLRVVRETSILTPVTPGPPLGRGERKGPPRAPHIDIMMYEIFRGQRKNRVQKKRSKTVTTQSTLKYINYSVIPEQR
jgi:hypothetical protein